jgi:hypothetical protein
VLGRVERASSFNFTVLQSFMRNTSPDLIDNVVDRAKMVVAGVSYNKEFVSLCVGGDVISMHFCHGCGGNGGHLMDRESLYRLRR